MRTIDCIHHLNRDITHSICKNSYQRARNRAHGLLSACRLLGLHQMAEVFLQILLYILQWERLVRILGLEGTRNSLNHCISAVKERI